MTSRQRMRVAMARGIPDRVPLMCQLALGHYFLHSGLDAIDIWHDGEAFAQALVAGQRRYRFDGVLVNLPGRDPRWRDHVARVEAAGDDVRRIVWRDGGATLVPHDDNPYPVAEDGKRHAPSFAELDPARLYYVEPHALGGARYPARWGLADEPAPVGGPDFFPPWQCDTLRRVRELAGDGVSVHAELFSPFSQLMELLDHAEALMALVIDPGKVDAILERLTAGAICLGRLYAQSGCDALLVSSAFVGAGLLSRAHYERFELPCLRQLVAGIKELRPDLPIYVHTCGAIGDRLDLIEASGVDGIDTLDPPPIGTVDLAEALAVLGKRVFLKGNLDPVHTLLAGGPAVVRAAARERLRVAKPGGAYILSSACSVPPHTPPENLEVLAAVIEEEGDYRA